MRMLIQNGSLYINNHYTCHVEAGNGRTSFEPRSSEVRTEFSHALQKVLPYAEGIGWFGSDPECSVILGTVRGRDRIIPSVSAVSRLASLVEGAESLGEQVMLTIKD